MKKTEIMGLSMSELEKRSLEIAEAAATAEDEELNQLEEELEAIEERKSQLLTQKETRSRIVEAVKSQRGRAMEEQDKTPGLKDIEEYRNSKEYIDLYAEYLKTKDDTEIRAALLSTNAENGTIPVPTFVYDIIKTAWDRNEIMSLVTRLDVNGNLEIPFEIYGSDAVIHIEGSEAVAEQELQEGIVTLIPEFAKKWKSFSKTVYKLRGEAFVRYIYDEITYRIIKLLCDNLIELIANLPETPSATSPSAAKIYNTPALGTIAEAISYLSDDATDPVIIMNKRTWGAFKAAQYAGNFAADIFEGLRVHYSSKLPAYGAAEDGAVYAIVGDFREGTLANFPTGEEVEFTFDALTRKKENIIEVLGELYHAAGVVADKAFTLIAKGSGDVSE